VAESTAADLPSTDAVSRGMSMTAMNGRPASASGPQREIEPIDLLHHAGPAVAKRLAPVAVAALVVLIAVRRHRRG
jgi:succinate dehydrogenase/fumarate reductase flavoprotein subunit